MAGLRFSDVEGWLSEDQAQRLAAAARQVPAGGRIVEIGSFRGRSTIVFAQSAPEAGEVVAIDPHAGSHRGPQEFEPNAAVGQSDHERFLDNLARAGVEERVRHVRAFSQDALDQVDGAIDLLYVDGAHHYGPARDDIRAWGARVKPGGTMLIHDSFSSVGVTAALGRLLFLNEEFTFCGRTRSLAEYRRTKPAGRARNALRQVAQLPWFARNLIVKLAILLRVHSGHWPY